MTEYEKIADLLFGQDLKTPEEYEALYPPRDLAEGQRVTRLAPSPTPPTASGRTPTVRSRSAKTLLAK